MVGALLVRAGRIGWIEGGGNAFQLFPDRRVLLIDEHGPHFVQSRTVRPLLLVSRYPSPGCPQGTCASGSTPKLSQLMFLQKFDWIPPSVGGTVSLRRGPPTAAAADVA